LLTKTTVKTDIELNSDSDTELAPGDILKTARKKAGLSLREAEAATGISHSHLSQMETGRKRLTSLSFLSKLCKAYRMNPREILKTNGISCSPTLGETIRGLVLEYILKLVDTGLGLGAGTRS